MAPRNAPPWGAEQEPQRQPDRRPLNAIVREVITTRCLSARERRAIEHEQFRHRTEELAERLLRHELFAETEYREQLVEHKSDDALQVGNTWMPDYRKIKNDQPYYTYLTREHPELLAVLDGIELAYRAAQRKAVVKPPRENEDQYRARHNRREQREGEDRLSVRAACMANFDAHVQDIDNDVAAGRITEEMGEAEKQEAYDTLVLKKLREFDGGDAAIE